MKPLLMLLFLFVCVCVCVCVCVSTCQMADAGFYHCPTDREPDVVRCYVCFKELEGWEPQDDPW